MRKILLFLLVLTSVLCYGNEPRLFWYTGQKNFGDHLSKVIVDRMTKRTIPKASLGEKYPVLFAVGSIMRKVRSGDVVWGSGFRQNPLRDNREKYQNLDIRAVRGPRTRALLLQMGAKCPEVYGDPALLLPKLFPELKRQTPVYDYIVIPHLTERGMFAGQENVVFTHEPWEQVVDKILKSKLVISSSLHGLIVAEAFGIPARLLKVTWNEGILKYQDYYESTGRPNFSYAKSVDEAIKMGGESPIKIDLKPLLDAFPYDYFDMKANR